MPSLKVGQTNHLNDLKIQLFDLSLQTEAATSAKRLYYMDQEHLNEVVEPENKYCLYSLMRHFMERIVASGRTEIVEC
jgi:hypothetical protein